MFKKILKKFKDIRIHSKTFEVFQICARIANLNWIICIIIYIFQIVWICISDDRLIRTPDKRSSAMLSQNFIMKLFWLNSRYFVEAFGSNLTIKNPESHLNIFIRLIALKERSIWTASRRLSFENLLESQATYKKLTSFCLQALCCRNSMIDLRFFYNLNFLTRFNQSVY